MNGNKSATPTAWVDPDDAPELSADFFDRADEVQGSQRVRRDRPPTGMPRKEVTTIRLSPEVMDDFKATGAGWQTRIDAALKGWLKTHSPGLWQETRLDPDAPGNG